MNKTVVIGLTGTTGAGKSEVSRLLARRGCEIVDADVLARRAVEPGSEALAALAARFSNEILQADGSLDRAALATRAFATPEATADMNAIVHPAVLRMMRDALDNARGRGVRAVVLDVPLLFQTGSQALCDVTVTVTAPFAVRRQRICERDGLSEAQAELRMNAQPDETYYTEQADRVIVNNGTREELQKKVEALCTEVLT